MRHLGVFAVIAAAGALVAACTSSGSPTPGTSTIVQTVTETRPGPSPSIGTPVPAGPTTVTDASSCPLLEEQYAADTSGMRLDRIAVLKSDGKVIGCRIYGLQHPNADCPWTTCLKKERLPPGNQPAIEITSKRYSNAAGAKAAFIALGKKGANIQQATITSGNVGLCYQTDFYAKDHGTDWACAYSVGDTLVLVRTVVTSPAYSVIQIAKSVATKF